MYDSLYLMIYQLRMDLVIDLSVSGTRFYASF